MGFDNSNKCCLGSPMNLQYPPGPLADPPEFVGISVFFTFGITMKYLTPPTQMLIQS